MYMYHVKNRSEGEENTQTDRKNAINAINVRGIYINVSNIIICQYRSWDPKGSTILKYYWR